MPSQLPKDFINSGNAERSRSPIEQQTKTNSSRKSKKPLKKDISPFRTKPINKSNLLKDSAAAVTRTRTNDLIIKGLNSVQLSSPISSPKSNQEISQPKKSGRNKSMEHTKAVSKEIMLAYTSKAVPPFNRKTN